MILLGALTTLLGVGAAAAPGPGLFTELAGALLAAGAGGVRLLRPQTRHAARYPGP